ncbi:MAG: hypothetical protein V4819_12285 [Verrucomicrobiota bacterium]
MRSSNLRPWPGLILAIGTLGVLRADDLTLADDARLTGTVRSINEAGVVELTSALSPEPVLLKSGAVAKVEFSAPTSVPNAPGSLIELANGDLLPATIESLDDKSLSVVTPDAGRLTIPRAALKSVQLGVHKRKVIYSGPQNLEEWNRDGEGAKSWTFANKSLVANGPVSASKNFETPQQFIIKFTLKWQANPGFKIFFADPLTPKVEAVDRYYMQFNSAGLEIKRESSQGTHFQTVMIPPITPDKYPANQVDVEIRVDRKTSRLHLFLNGEPEGAGFDPGGKAPVGGGVTLVSSAPAGISQEILGIEVSEFDNTRSRHRAEDRGDPKTDSLISRDEDRWGGRLTGIRPGPDGTVFSFKSDFQEDPLELSEADVSTIFFAKRDQEAVPEPLHPFALRLRGDGSLHVSSCTFTEDSISALHPLLGALKINRAGVTALERLDAKPEVKSDE